MSRPCAPRPRINVIIAIASGRRVCCGIKRITRRSTNHAAPVSKYIQYLYYFFYYYGRAEALTDRVPTVCAVRDRFTRKEHEPR